MNDLINRVRKIYERLRAETNSEPQITFSQLVQELDKPVQNCHGCASHSVWLCPIHPLPTYAYSEANTCPDWSEKRWES